jgi:hypothetical protein
MSVSWQQTPERVVVVRISGRLEPSEWLAAQMAVSKLLNDEPASSSIMVIAESFEGFARGDWNDMTFVLKNDSRIARIAIVADPKWEDQMLLFAGAGLRKFEMKFFPAAEMAQARAWVTPAVKATA